MRKKVVGLVAALMVSVLLNGLTVCAEIGSTGYRKVVQVPRAGTEFYLTVEAAAEVAENLKNRNPKAMTGIAYPVEESGLYELDGRVVYLDRGHLAKMRIIDNYYINPDGVVMPYDASTKAAVDAEVNMLLNQKKAEVQNLYGVAFSFRSDYSACENYRFAEEIRKEFASYPAGSVPIIANATKNRTGKTMTFRQKFGPNEGYFTGDATLVGLYTAKSNMVQTSMDREVVAHEMGHGMEPVLNSFLGGKLKAEFTALNGGAGYNSNYFYSGDASVYGTQPACFKSAYAATSFSEDFAETFSSAMCDTTAELNKGVEMGYIKPEYCQKVLYVKQIFNQYAGAEILQ